jgi:hypothetical protein
MRSEASIEASCCAYARRRGVVPIKLQAGVTGEPDRGFILPGHVLWLVEFKRPGGRMRPRQKQRHKELETLGIHVTTLDDRAHFVALLDMLLEAT